jgi:integrase
MDCLFMQYVYTCSKSTELIFLASGLTNVCSILQLYRDSVNYWAKKQHFRKKSVCQESIKRYIVPMRQICTETAIKYGWNTTFNPFFGFKMRQNVDRDANAEEEEILQLSIQEISFIRKELPEHWIPYFDFGVAAGLRPGEQIALKPRDIDWENGIIRVRRAMALDEDGKVIEGRTKNRHSRRDIRLTPAMLGALEAQRLINETLASEYFFCTPNGSRMIHRRYARYVRNVKGGQDGAKLSELLCSRRQG